EAGGTLTAARARNEGFVLLQSLHPDLEYVQFLDGDSELVDGWIETAGGVLERSPRTAAVCGGVRGGDREQSLVRRLMDMEWDRPAGTVLSCGGIFMARADAFRRAGMFDASVPFGEEADLCVRLRAQGLDILRIDEPMAVHDSGMVRFSQWWRR